jgi:CheY-like chemotaxis protein
MGLIAAGRRRRRRDALGSVTRATRTTRASLTPLGDLPDLQTGRLSVQSPQVLPCLTPVGAPVGETGMTKRVLIVDDEPNVVGILREFFARFQHGHAYVVVSASSAAEALDILLQGAFDLILLDLVIPGIGARWKQALDLLKRIRDLGVTAPVLMMSGDWDIRKEAEALSAGAVGYLHKPFNLRDLDHSVALVLGPRAPGG